MLHENLITTHTGSHADARRAFLQRSRVLLSSRRITVLLAATTVALMWLWASVETPPRAWAVNEVPIAFWAWRADAPTAADIESVRAQTNATTLFLRAGQIDYANGKFTRIRSVEGAPPANIETHLVYNATEATLDSFATLDTETLALFIAATYLNDAEQSRARGANIRGLQLDFDAPTRLLTRYTEILLHLRRRLPQTTQLSITGLPTWMDAPALKRTLAATDFWIPQFYGDHIPRTLTDDTAIADTSRLTRDLTRARRLAHPFYAGLPAYGYALLYSPRGALIALRGDISPALVARDQRLQLVNRQPAGSSDTSATTTPPTPTAWRYDFLANSDAETGGLNIRTGEHLLLEIPTAAGLRLMASITRQTSGTHLRGICLFRLPTTTDPTTLTARELAHALADRPTHTEAALELTRITPREPERTTASDTRDHTQTISLTARNPGAATARVGDEAFTLTLRIPAGSLHSIPTLEGFTRAETLCDGASALTTHTPMSPATATLRPCSLRRANALRLSAPTWAAGEEACATLVISDALPPEVSVEITLRTDAGQQLHHDATIHITQD